MTTQKKVDWHLTVGIIGALAGIVGVLIAIVAILTNTPTGQKFVETNVIQKIQQLIPTPQPSTPRNPWKM